MNTGAWPRPTKSPTAAARVPSSRLNGTGEAISPRPTTTMRTPSTTGTRPLPPAITTSQRSGRHVRGARPDFSARKRPAPSMPESANVEPPLESVLYCTTCTGSRLVTPPRIRRAVCSTDDAPPPTGGTPKWPSWTLRRPGSTPCSPRLRIALSLSVATAPSATTKATASARAAVASRWLRARRRSVQAP